METKSLKFSELVPQEVANSSKANLSKSETNLLGALCYTSLKSKSEWFTIGQKELFEMVNVSLSQGNRIIRKLVEKCLIERKRGTNGSTTKYKLHPAITVLLAHDNMDVSDDNMTHDNMDVSDDNMTHDNMDVSDDNKTYDNMDVSDDNMDVSEMEDGSEELVINDVVKACDAEVKTEKEQSSEIPYDHRAVPQWESDALFEFIENGTRDLKWNEVKGFQKKVDEYVANFIDTSFYTAMRKVANMRLNKIYERKLYRRE